MNRSPRRLVFVAPCLSLMLACVSAPPRPTSDAPATAPPVEALVRVHDTSARRDVGFDEFLDALARADAVFLGETHLDDTTHRVEEAVLEGLLERRGGRVVLSLEMFERDAQGALDDYLAGRIDEAAFLMSSRPWNNYRTGYRDLVELAKARGIPVVAANAPASIRSEISTGGREALEKLAPEKRRLLPEEIYPASEKYWERVSRAVRGHSMGFSAEPSEESLLFSAQNLWDNSMGDAVAKALRENPGHAVLHVVGGFHVEYRDGTVAQFSRRAPSARSVVATISLSTDLVSERPERDLGRADYLVYADARASGPSDGRYTATVSAEIRFTLDVPHGASSVPLVVFLPDDETRPRDARAWVRSALAGGSAAIAVVEPPLVGECDGLVLAGRWSFPATFREDLGRAHEGLRRIVEYATRRFPVDRERVVVAGLGAGALPVVSSALYTSTLDARFLAISPRGVKRLRQEALPDTPPVTRHVTFAAMTEGPDDASGAAEDFAALSVPFTLSEKGPEDALRAEIGLAPKSKPAGGPLTVLVLVNDAPPRAREWAALAADFVASGEGRTAVVPRSEVVRAIGAARSEGRAVRVKPMRFGGEPLAIEGTEALSPFMPSDLANGHGLPKAEGPFGGTTVLVVPASASDAEKAAWLELETSNAIKKLGRFFSLAVAFENGSPTLPETLAALREKGRRNLLVVPAVFCATADEMRALRRSAGEELRGFDVAWLPGLGGEVTRIGATSPH